MVPSILDPRQNGGVQMPLICEPSDRSKPGLYRIQNIVNGRVYIGSTSKFSRRYSGHKGKLRHGRHGNHALQKDWNEYGESSFEMHVIKAFEERPSKLIEANELEFWRQKIGREALYNGNMLILERIFHTIDGRTQPANDWIKELGLPRVTIYKRLENGMTATRAFSPEHSNCSLSNSQAKEIRIAFANGETAKSLQARYKLSQVAMSRLLRGETYKDA